MPLHKVGRQRFAHCSSPPRQTLVPETSTAVHRCMPPQRLATRARRSYFLSTVPIHSHARRCLGIHLHAAARAGHGRAGHGVALQPPWIWCATMTPTRATRLSCGACCGMKWPAPVARRAVHLAGKTLVRSDASRRTERKLWHTDMLFGRRAGQASGVT